MNGALASPEAGEESEVVVEEEVKRGGVQLGRVSIHFFH